MSSEVGCRLFSRTEVFDKSAQLFVPTTTWMVLTFEAGKHFDMDHVPSIFNDVEDVDNSNLYFMDCILGGGLFRCSLTSTTI